ncbi:hypothetical protein [Giesbergeria anulus]|uniref:Uncharacterized protein n=1 Tax=Giesbergeria anulus TaxID=180197 RepID=A0A1H9NHR8_9BURK|nr:hypothetical protein [Giesbergeria anulus]SER35458.1 hypothetical protein SAMN02982919_02222 [Giesbergeria anulus]
MNAVVAKEIHLLRAASLGGNSSPPNLKIIVGESQMPDNLSIEAAKEIYAAQAKELADGLLKSLPGGTLDQLLAELLERKASLLRVPR